jgi:DNA-binding response OmpR family regulator
MRPRDHMPRRLILVIEADDAVSCPIVDQLAADDHPAKIARSANHATALAMLEPPLLVVLGTLDTPNSALALLRLIRRGGPDAPWQPNVPVILLSPRTEESDLLRAFEAGADDFLAHPPSYLELRARLRAVLRRTTIHQDNRVLQVGPLRIDTAAHTATLHDRLLDLCRLEYELLVHLASEPTRVFRTPDILRTVWGYATPGRTRTLDSHASRLRRKLNAVGGRWIINVRGVGYRLI